MVDMNNKCNMMNLKILKKSFLFIEEKYRLWITNCISHFYLPSRKRAGVAEVHLSFEVL